MPDPRKAPDSSGPFATYRAKRDFTKTTEPAGEEGRHGGQEEPLALAGDRHGTEERAFADARRFVVQRHRARRLHYDLRLEMEGVLVSWAVPRGPTLDPDVRRAAFHVEDHPVEYFDFEGVIPKGEYGGGDVIVWDEGTWEPDEAGDPPDPARAVREGELHFDLRGHKLNGRFVLVRTRVDAGGKEQWLLLHKHDDHAVAGWDPEDHPRSVLSGRTNDEVEAPSPQPAPAPLPGPSPDELAELDALKAAGTWQVFGRPLRVTNLDKVLFSGRPGDEPLTKRDLLRYAAEIAPIAMAYLAGRALNMHRFPGGAGTRGFWHKQLPSHAPDWLPRWDNPEARAGEAKTYLVVDEPAALVWAANFGALEWHAWTSKTDQPHLPTYVLIDLDPGEKTSWEDLVLLARLHRAALEHLGLLAQPKLTGRRGLHIWVPLRPGPSFSETRAWAAALSRAISQVAPDLVSWKWRVGERSGLARLDYTQNALNKTLVAPYSPRAAAGAPVSAPIEWAELEDPALAPGKFTVRNVLERVATKGDLFRTVLQQSQELPKLG